MTNNKPNIEDLFKDNLKDFSITPDNSVWTKINRSLFFKRFFKFKPATFNIYYSILIGTISSIAIFNINNNSESNTKNDLIKNTTINSQNISNKKNEIIDNEEIQKTNINNKNNEQNNIKIINKKEEIKNATQNNLSETLVNDKNETTKENANLEPEKNINSKLAKPSANFSANTYSACEPATIVFSNASENCDSFLWNFGNEESSKEANPTFVFNTAGEYTVKLTVYSGSFTSTISKEIIVHPKPKADFIISDKNDLFMNDEIKFANLSSNFTSCSWDFGDEDKSNFTHPSHIYEDDGFYDISLICFSKDKCSDTAKIKNLQIKEDKYKILAPTALSIDKNGANSGYTQKGMYSNSVFKPIFNITPNEYHLRIFNKFGSVVFESDDINFGWNGYYNNKPAIDDVYIWECTGNFENGQAFFKTGNLTLLYKRNQ